MRVLITGAAGGVGQQLVPALAGEHQLRLTDVRPLPTGSLTGNLTEPGLAERLCDGVDAVVHLAGNPQPSNGWDQLRGPNLDAVTRILDAAAKTGVRRVVLASSVHAMGGYHPLASRPAPVPIRDDWPGHPCCRYGATKLFAEAAGRVYADSGAMSVVCLRLGGCRPAPPTRAWFDAWLGQTDLAQAVRRALRAEVAFGSYTITSANRSGVFDIGAAERDLGYLPTERAESYVDASAAGPRPTTLCRV
ncbi:MAG TPA: NAD(P)-dependent oxidoreductase [Asanoa sp.]|nr:NAD(P)-dependent oxidoreductase [Asanoa sp.]